MSNIHPIKPDIIPQIDQRRELIDYCMGRLAAHAESFGEADTIAIVTMSNKGRIGHSFSLRDEQDKLGTCSSAAAILLERAVQ